MFFQPVRIKPMTESFAELFEESLLTRNLKPGSIVTGQVVEIRDDAIVVNAGLKSEGIVPISQFRNSAGELEVELGDNVEVALDAVEDGFGETRLSREKAKRALVWDKLENAFTDAETIEGKISGKVKGGFTVDIHDIRAFLPGSLVDVRPVRDPAYLEGKDLEFKMVRIWNSKSSNWTESVTTSWFPAAQLLSRSSVRNVKKCWPVWKRAPLSRVWLKTSPITVHSWIWAV
jgi:ribosomal protein S1